MIRRLHPDFHIPEYVTSVASEFDGDDFADSLVDAHIDSVVIFAKCSPSVCTDWDIGTRRLVSVTPG